jgi:diguanylate cyclase (GGDEF)-like protein
LEVTKKEIFWREHVFRWALILCVLAFSQTGDQYVGGKVNFTFLYAMAAIHALCNLAYWLKPDYFNYRGKLRFLVAGIDFAMISAAVAATGGVSSNFYLLYGIIPLIFGAYFGIWGALATGILELAAFSIIIAVIPHTKGGLLSLAALRYTYIAGSTLMDTYITDILIKDREKLSILYRIAQGGSSSPALSKVLSSMIEVLSKTFDAEKVLIFLLDETGKRLELQQPALGVDEEDEESMEAWANRLLPLIDQGDHGALVIGGRRTRGTGDTGLDESFAEEVGHCILAALSARGKRLGLMVVCHGRGKRVRKREVRMLDLISSHASIYLENALLYRTSEENVAQLSSLIRVADAIGTVSSLDHIYNLALDVVRGLFAADMALINIINHETGLLEPVRHFGFSNKYQEHNISHPFERIESCFVLTNDRAFLSDDVSTDLRCPNLRVEKGVRSVLCVPIRSGHVIYGILHMASRYHQAFNQNDVTLANAIGEQVGMAVERARLFEEINRLAITDALTGLYNRRYLSGILEEEIRRSSRYGHHLSFVMIDIDHFKFYNDHHGHPMGDELLRRLAALLRENVREVDTVFRYGGEEFSILAPELDKQDVAFMADRLRRVVKEHRFPYEEEQPEGDLTISLGVACYPEDASNGEELIERSDKALYLAKRQGRDRVCVYTNGSGG